MEKITKTLRYNKLLEIYKDLLTHTQVDILTTYFEYDLSISEISEEKGISRAAVEDAIKKGIAKLDELENKLLILSKREKVLKMTAKLKEKSLNQGEIDFIDELERNL